MYKYKYSYQYQDIYLKRPQLEFIYRCVISIMFAIQLLAYKIGVTIFHLVTPIININIEYLIFILLNIHVNRDIFRK